MSTRDDSHIGRSRSFRQRGPCEPGDGSRPLPGLVPRGSVWSNHAVNFVLDLVLVLHFLGLAAILGAWLVQRSAPKVTKAFLHGAIVQVVTGLLLVGLREMQDLEVNNAKIGIKMFVALAILVISIIGVRKEKTDPDSTALLANVAAALAVVNIAVAVLV
jgi:hypothetical protein